MRLLVVFVLAWNCVARINALAEERLFVDAKVNGAPVRMAFDSGSESLFLFRSSAERLGLKMSMVKTFFRRHDYFGTEKCRVEFWNISIKERVRVWTLPEFLHPEEDGMIGWDAVRHKTFEIDALNHTIRFLTQVPNDASLWTRFRIESDYPILVLQAPTRSGLIIVDTGSESGIGIPPDSWRQWKQKHPDQPVTLDSAYTPGAGIFVREQAWANDFALGPLTLTDVLVEQADPWSMNLAAKELVATLGLAALKRLHFVIDGKHRIAYLRPKSAPAPEYIHNRLAAVFVPRDTKSDDLIAHVVEGGPAFDAGIRNGDVLLKIGQTATANWRTDTSYVARATCSKPSGTQISLTLCRSNETFTTTATLRDIIAPAGKRR